MKDGASAVRASRAGGQMRARTRPMTRSVATAPKERESVESRRLSPERPGGNLDRPEIHAVDRGLRHAHSTGRRPLTTSAPSSMPILSPATATTRLTSMSSLRGARKTMSWPRAGVA